MSGKGLALDGAELCEQLERCHRAGYGWALSCCGRDPLEAEEVLQIVYFKVLTGQARFEGRANFQTWLFAVIRKTAADERRKKALRQLWLGSYQERVESPKTEPSPDESVANSQTRALFLQALATLPRRQREVVHLVFYHDFSLSEAATVIGVSLGSARTHYERGKKALRQRLQHESAFHEIELGRTAVEGILS